ncbi:MAG: DpnD/PcfM family protein [Fretibacterium sp.]|nr:DpnD/PcfM family protein [Fretibacterium sp.]
MSRYPVNIRETLEKVIVVDASDEDEALDKVRNAWKRGKIVLSSENFTAVECSIFNGNAEDFVEDDILHEEPQK